VVLDGGDLFQGTLVSNSFKGQSVVDVYDAIGVTAAAVGNHEFDWGVGTLAQRMAQAKFPILVANLFKKGTRERPEWAKPTALVEVQGLKIGIIGLATVETPTVTNPVYVADYEFADGGPIAAQLADELRAQGASLVLVVAHAGPLVGEGSKSQSPASGEAQRIAAACGAKIDALVSGHHHTSVGCCTRGQAQCRCGTGPLTVAGVPIVQSGAKLTAFSVIELDLDESGHKTGQRVNEGTLPRSGGPQSLLHDYKGWPAKWRGREVKPDPQVAAIVAKYDAQVQKLRETPIGATEVALVKGGTDDLLANLASDALRSGAGGGLKAQYAFQNQGGLRVGEIPAGPITFGQIFDLTPFDNEQVVVTLKAHEIRNALEAILKEGKGPLRVSGLRYVVDWSNRGGELKALPPGKLVPLVVDTDTNQTLCKTDSCTADQCVATCAQGDFTVALTDFLANGGDGLALLKSAPRQKGPVLARDMVIGYVKEHVPLTPKLLGSTRAGGPVRIDQQGGQAAEHE
jgi:5'-nucleotidase